MGSRRGTLANVTNLLGTPGRLPMRVAKGSEGGDGGMEVLKPPAPRPSISRASIAPRASISRASLVPNQGRPSLNLSIRGMGRSMNSSTVGGGAPRKDPRDWRDKGFVVTCQKRMLKYLSEWGFPYGIGPKTLTSPSNKEFIQMFQFLYLRIDPSYKFGAKPEDEVLPILASLQYPFKIAKVRVRSFRLQVCKRLTCSAGTELAHHTGYAPRVAVADGSDAVDGRASRVRRSLRPLPRR